MNGCLVLYSRQPDKVRFGTLVKRLTSGERKMSFFVCAGVVVNT